jgi:hypothetical protein
LSPLVEALDRAYEFGFRIVSMKDDWTAVFPKPVQDAAAKPVATGAAAR